MKTQKLVDEIREANLSYIVLAQQLIREDRSEALFRLGLSDEVADIIDGLTMAQILKISSSNLLMCRFRFDDQVVWNLLTNHGMERGASGIHAAILMAGQRAEAT